MTPETNDNNGEDQGRDSSYNVHADGAEGVQVGRNNQQAFGSNNTQTQFVGDHNTQIQYLYSGRTWSDRVGPLPLVKVSGEVDSPYRGLAAFQERDAPFFCGREKVTDEVLEWMSKLARAEDPGILIVSGASGAGKSSLLQAGVIPQLRGRGLRSAPDAASWPCLLLTPGSDPLEQLALRISLLTRTDARDIQRGLETGPEGFGTTVRQAVLEQSLGPADAPDPARAQSPTDARLLLIVDQFEQVFTRCDDEEKRQRFITALLAAAHGSGPGDTPPALVVLGMRDDFAHRLTEYEKLAETVKKNRFLITPMTEQQMQLAIAEPAKRLNAQVDQDLTGALLAEVRTRQHGKVGTGVLPLLSHALDQTWRSRRAGNNLTLADYERTDGISGAISRSADRAYQSLTPDRQAVARRIFVRLVAISSDGLDSADRCTRTELIDGEGPAGADDVDAVLKAFADERLLTLADDSVEISHEALLTSWPLLRDEWLTETHTDRIIRTQLRIVADSWAADNRDPGYLYRGGPLDDLHRSAQSPRFPKLAGIEREFLDASNQAAARASFWRRTGVTTLVLLLVASVAGAGIAFSMYGRARQQTALAVSGQLAVKSESLDTSDPVTAALLAATSARIDRNNPTATESLLDAYAQPDHETLNISDLLMVAFSPDGRMLATSGGDGPVRLWSTSSHAQVGSPITVPDGSAVAFSPDGRTLATAGRGVVRLWSTSSHAQVSSPIAVPGSNILGSDSSSIGGGVLGVAFSPDGRTLATAAGDGMVRLWDTSSHAQVGSPIAVPDSDKSSMGGGVLGVAFSPDGRTLATVGGEGDVRLWSTSSHAQVGSPIAGLDSSMGGGVSGVAFSPDGRTLATAGDDGVVRLWSTSSHAQVGSPITVPGSNSRVLGLAFSPDGRTLATAGGDGAVRWWDTSVYGQVGSPIPVPGSGIGGVGGVGVTFSPDGRTLATAGGDGAVRLWSTSSHAQVGSPITVPGSNNNSNSGMISSITSGIGAAGMAFSPDGRTLATAGGDGAVRLWSTSSHAQVGSPIAVPGNTIGGSGISSGIGIGVMGVAFSPDGRTLATAGGDGAVRLWSTSSHAQVGSPITVPGNTIGGSGSGGVGVAFSPDGRTLATAGSDGAVRLWSTSSHAQVGSPITVPDNNNNGNLGVAFSPDGRTLATAGGDGAVRLWDTSTHAQIGRAITDPDGFWGVAFSPDGKTLATAGDGTVRLWNVAFPAPAHLLDAVCGIASRPLTHQEWNAYVGSSESFQQVCPARR